MYNFPTPLLTFTATPGEIWTQWCIFLLISRDQNCPIFGKYPIFFTPRPIFKFRSPIKKKSEKKTSGGRKPRRNDLSTNRADSHSQSHTVDSTRPLIGRLLAVSLFCIVIGSPICHFRRQWFEVSGENRHLIGPFQSFDALFGASSGCNK